MKNNDYNINIDLLSLNNNIVSRLRILEKKLLFRIE
jgi:hypothetical protein